MANKPQLKNIVSGDELGRMLGVTAATVRVWTAAGMPVLDRGSRGIAGKFDSTACIRWWADNISGRASAVDTDHEEADRRRAVAEAELAELKLAEKRGELVDGIEVRDVQIKAFANVKARMLSIPSAVAASCAATSEPAVVQSIVSGAIKSALSELSNGVVEHERDRPDEPSGGSIEAPAGSKNKPVGRGKKNPKSRGKRRTGAVAKRPDAAPR